MTFPATARPYHIQFPNYEERMKIIAKNALAWFRVAEQTPLFTMTPSLNDKQGA